MAFSALRCDPVFRLASDRSLPGHEKGARGTAAGEESNQVGTQPHQNTLDQRKGTGAPSVLFTKNGHIVRVEPHAMGFDGIKAVFLQDPKNVLAAEVG